MKKHSNGQNQAEPGTDLLKLFLTLLLGCSSDAAKPKTALSEMFGKLFNICLLLLYLHSNSI